MRVPAVGGGQAAKGRKEDAPAAEELLLPEEMLRRWRVGLPRRGRAKRRLGVRVSVTLRERALGFLGALAGEAARVGLMFVVENRRGGRGSPGASCSAALGDGRVGFSLGETHEETKSSRKRRRVWGDETRTIRPTGRLYFMVDAPRPDEDQTEWRDGRGGMIEDKVAEIASALANACRG